MRKVFDVTLERHVAQRKTIGVEAETETEARGIALRMDKARAATGWSEEGVSPAKVGSVVERPGAYRKDRRGKPTTEWVYPTPQ